MDAPDLCQGVSPFQVAAQQVFQQGDPERADAADKLVLFPALLVDLLFPQAVLAAAHSVAAHIAVALQEAAVPETPVAVAAAQSVAP
jgi:hypothetical protein